MLTIVIETVFQSLQKGILRSGVVECIFRYLTSYSIKKTIFPLCVDAEYGAQYSKFTLSVCKSEIINESFAEFSDKGGTCHAVIRYFLHISF